MALLVVIVLLALMFDFLNGFHDAIDFVQIGVLLRHLLHQGIQFFDRHTAKALLGVGHQFVGVGTKNQFVAEQVIRKFGIRDPELAITDVLEKATGNITNIHMAGLLNRGRNI